MVVIIKINIEYVYNRIQFVSHSELAIMSATCPHADPFSVLLLHTVGKKIDCAVLCIASTTEIILQCLGYCMYIYSQYWMKHSTCTGLDIYSVVQVVSGVHELADRNGKQMLQLIKDKNCVTVSHDQ